MPGANLLDRQIEKSRRADGSVDYEILKRLVVAAYDDKELDRRRVDRASRLVAEELQEAFQSMELQNVRFKAALDNMGQGLCLYDASGRVVVANRRFGEIFELPQTPCCVGAPIDQVLDASVALCRASDMERRLLSVEIEFLDRKRGATLEQVWPDGRIISMTRTAVADGGFLDTFSDITEARRLDAMLSHQARHDALTDLPNRVLLRERLEQAIRDTDREHTAAVLCLDLDRFKLVNDTLGHPIGDALLIAVSQRLRGLVRESDLVARLGGDEFAIIQRLLPTAAMPEALARRVIGVLSEPYLIAGHQIQIGVSIGIDCVTESGMNPDEVLRNADLALYQAKSSGGGYRLFDPSMHAMATKRRQLELDLRAAITNGQFEVYYQPQVNVGRGDIIGFEALVRWRHPQRGLVSPADFIPLSEEIGLIERLGAFVLRRACADAATWARPVTVAVNLSAVQFRSGRLAEVVEAALTESGLDPSRLELEITEGVLLVDTAATMKQLRQLKQLGARISLDDFGTGYSSLSYIRHFAFDKIKIDQSFVRELETSQDSLAIIRAVTAMCSSLGITTTAEGVETAAQMEILTREHCDIAQGFLFGRAVPGAEVAGLLGYASAAAA